MTLNETRRTILDALAAGPVSGPALATELGISRTGVWKHIDALRAAGFDIESTPSGYVVRSVPEYGALAVQYGLDQPYRVFYEDVVQSTNDIARVHASRGERDVVVLADEQSGGRGRLDRAWRSPTGGIWMSLLVRPELPPARVPVLTLAGGVATAEAIHSAGVPVGIKWPNDVVVPGGPAGPRKIAGVLTEMEGEANRVKWVIIGIGVNANVSGDALPDNATSIEEQAGRIDRRVVVQRIIRTFDVLLNHPDEIGERWRSIANTLGTDVRVETPDGTIEGTAVDITDIGALVLDTQNGRVTVHTGDCTHLRPA